VSNGAHPVVHESPTTAPAVPAQPNVQEYRGGGSGSPLYDQQYQQQQQRQNPPAPNPGSGSSFQRSAPVQAKPSQPPVAPKMDRIAAVDGNWKPVETASR
jgi:hypothetical protein